MRMPQSDWMVEGVYDTVSMQKDERARLEVARAAYLAAASVLPAGRARTVSLGYVGPSEKLWGRVRRDKPACCRG